MGHSAGGLFTQILLDHGYGAAGVVIDSTPAEGIRVTPVSQIRSLFPFLKNPANRHKAAAFQKPAAGSPLPLRLVRRLLREEPPGRTCGLNGGGHSRGGEWEERGAGGFGSGRGSERRWGVLDFVPALFGRPRSFGGEARNQRLPPRPQGRHRSGLGRRLVAALPGALR
jgi:hypothetical protein